MKITQVEAIVLRLPQVNVAADGTQDTCLIRVDTDAGISGWGESDSCPTAVKAVVDAPLSHSNCSGLARVLVGLDPLAIEVCNHRMRTAANYYSGGGLAVHAMAGIDMALWDIAGKALGKPVYQLLGGPFQTRMRAYSSVLFGDTPAATYEAARRWADRGFTAVKFGWGPMGRAEATDVALVREARRGLGESPDLLVDAGECFDARTAIRRASQFLEYRPYWLEEMLHPDDLAGYRKLAAVSPTPVAAGETAARLDEYLRMLDEGDLDWIQPDPSRCGISTMIAVGRAALARHKRVCNHTFKSGITIAASLHVMAALPGTDLVEFCMADSPLRHDLTRERFEVVDGYTSVSDRPGLGVTVNLDTIAKFRVA
ncbi:mandelate racemase/muconate lactonizing enzyme family protein [Fimbriiglobus ruber]|uniref:Mandelate racemase/muconate lactonizing enzyme family protein n=1 Tax=Fimbriiglobus ruber TaxID=1908690 RepID=A0A225D9H7_9BACT|nr:mandelate racemase/muconate lactonizing enzyme family protein [Fimbriiglobus ruber]OWK38260.1 mandelate racemase/muconate lactonizing enzyme family protein [Fimbriiglobus ruber]